MKVRVLSEEMTRRIAAGEVVERPASVVKELIENSLDAGASEILIWLEKSGTSLIRISDNGEGMAPDDLALAVERHATSKVKDGEDLFRIATLGFRGEALPSIGSIAKMEIVSRPADAPSGHRLYIDGGKKEEIREAPAAPGTKIEIREIFFNTPGRRKFLKSPATELSHICDVVNRLALAHAGVHFRLQHDGRNLADYVAVEDAKDRIHQVLGRDVAKNLTRFAWRQSECAASGYLSSAPTSYPNARHLYTFVNKRYVRDKVLNHAMMQGYDTLLMKGQYPVVILSLEIPFAEVDVNVHPAKYEVRFRRQSDIHQAVSRGIRAALRREAKIPEPRLPPGAAPSFAGVSEFPIPYSTSSSMPYTGAGHRPEVFVLPPKRETPSVPGFFSSLQILGQILGCYLVCASGRGLALIDQHAAHERVAFERLKRQLDAGNIEQQSLLIPQAVELSAGELMLLEQKIDLLEHFGFALKPFGPETYAITAVPALLPEGDYRQMVRQMVAELAEVDNSARLRQRLEERLATIACHGVIRANRRLETGEIDALLRELDQIEFATQCPHGRPVLREIDRDDLERMFKRVL